MDRIIHGRAALGGLAASLVFLLLTPLAASAQETGRVVGRVAQRGTAQPLETANVTIVGTAISALTGTDGRYLLQDVPAGSHTLQVQLLGHGTVERPITVIAGEVTVVDVALQIEAIAMQEIVATGVIGATPKTKLPFNVEQLRVEDLPVPQVDAATALQGKIAGVTVVRGSGLPGSAPSILLRGPTAIDASGRSQEPLFVVDGIILGQSLVDMDALDIENIEVVKGAAAASLYGSRAASGVIQITTKRGRTLSSGEVAYTVRSEYGRGSLEGEFDFLRSHFWELTPDGTQFVDGSGTACDFLECGSTPRLAGQTAGAGTRTAWNTFATNPWPGGARNQVDVFFQGGAFQQHYLSATGRAGATNFHMSYSRLQNEGILPGQEGFTRDNFRLNIDQAVLENVYVSGSAFYSRGEQDQFPESAGAPLFGLTRMLPGVDLTACEDDPSESCLNDPDRIILTAQPFNIESENPIYEMLVVNRADNRNRFLGAGSARWTPVPWLDLDANVSYDRLERPREQLWPKGFRTNSPSQFFNEGRIILSDLRAEAFNSSLTATARFDVTDRIRNRTQVRYLYEQDDTEFFETDAFEFAVRDVPTLGNALELLPGESFVESIRADGYFLITNFEINDRYIVDALVRNDGSSLFGSDERRHWYYRLAGAWRLTQEPWFTLPLDELKLRASYGTAGGRPRYDAQYETYDLVFGRVVPATLGNVDLKPEFSKEFETGIDALFWNGRAGVTFTYANTVTDDQILRVPQPGFSGFEAKWQNAGTLESNTFELSLDARVIRTPEMSWSLRLLFDHTRSEITQLGIPPFVYGVPGQALENVYYAREGEQLGTFYGVRYAQSCADLPPNIVGCDEFAVDDEGYLVWVGPGGSLADNNWGMDSGLTSNGAPFPWGTPIQGSCVDRTSGQRTFFCPVGNSMPDYALKFSSTFNWRDFSLYALIDTEQGFDVYNQPLQWALFRRNIGMMDQTGLPQDDQKPIGYYDALYGVSGLQPSNVFVEDGSYVKLREVSLSYRLRGDQLRRLFGGVTAISGVTFTVTGRNLITWTDYRGYDPEIGATGGDTGSAALARVDGYQYPNFRTWTFGAEINF